MFIGSVFSPYYAAARRGGAGEAANHCAFNVALTHPGGSRWAMTERGRRRLYVDDERLAVGPSSARWLDGKLVVQLDERCAPLPRRVRGEIRVHPEAITGEGFYIDRNQNHRWWPVAPRCRVEVELERPGWRWSGDGYLDANRGDEPLERAFRAWQWARAHVEGGAIIQYDVVPVAEAARRMTLEIDRGGGISFSDPISIQSLPRTFWGIDRGIACDPDHTPTVRETWESGPFYARSLVDTQWRGRPVAAVHESLSLTRFDHRLVQLMLPFRMPRALR